MRRVLLLPLMLLAAAPALADDRAAAQRAYDRAAAALAAGQARTALVESRNAVQADPAWGAAHAQLGQVQLALDNGDAALAELQRARSAGVAPAELHHLLAHAELLTGRPQDALREADPAQVPQRFAAYAARIRGQAQAALGDMAAAGAEFDAALALSPDDSAAWSDAGHFRLQAANQAGAVEAADRAVALDPGNLDALLLKGDLARDQYGLVAALPWFERALAIDPNDVPALLEAAATMGDLGRMQDMLALTRRVIALDGGNAQAFYLQAVLAARAGDFDLARSLIQHSGDALDDVPGAMLLHATLEIDAGSLQQAIARLDRLMGDQPDNLRVRRLLGAAMAQAGDDAGAIDTLQGFADRPDADSYMLAVVGRAYESLGDRAAATRYLDRAARPLIGESLPFGTGADLETLSRAAQRDPTAAPRIAFIRGLIAAGQIPRAVSEAQALQQANPGTPAAHMLVGDALVAEGRFAEAAQAYRLAANIGFTEPVALRLIDAFQRGGQAPAALETLRLFLAQNPQNVAARMLAANYYRIRGDWARAIPILEGLRARLGNRDAVILITLAWGYLETGRARTGLPYAAAAYDLLPANPAAADGYGWLLFKAGGNRAQAIELLEKAHDIAPAAPDSAWHLAQAYAAAGRTPAARALTLQALADPHFADRAAAIAWLGAR